MSHWLPAAAAIDVVAGPSQWCRPLAALLDIVVAHEDPEAQPDRSCSTPAAAVYDAPPPQSWRSSAHAASPSSGCCQALAHSGTVGPCPAPFSGSRTCPTADDAFDGTNVTRPEQQRSRRRSRRPRRRSTPPPAGASGKRWARLGEAVILANRHCCQRVRPPVRRLLPNPTPSLTRPGTETRWCSSRIHRWRSTSRACCATPPRSLGRAPSGQHNRRCSRTRSRSSSRGSKR